MCTLAVSAPWRPAVVSLVVGALLCLSGACSQAPQAPASPERSSPSTDTAGDGLHAGITTPHGDHSPHHGGLVLMNGETHYEVVMHPEGRVELWLSNAVREDLPASLASDVQVRVTLGSGQTRDLAMALDESGESWVGTGVPFPVDPSATVTVSYTLQGQTHEVEIPYTPATTTVDGPTR
ncbi:MAG: hypothetical protein FJW29_03935 [Acidobacteria bacterium]|nr:hypothetical protein [Acidobacteriota bacterium]